MRRLLSLAFDADMARGKLSLAVAYRYVPFETSGLGVNPFAVDYASLERFYLLQSCLKGIRLHTRFPQRSCQRTSASAEERRVVRFLHSCFQLIQRNTGLRNRANGQGKFGIAQVFAA